ncbi:hypothetical protein DE146DRAFT_278235 [Phaeosphaeria sp. MPI-PUGE-AT-0046c]|nr:hypothetical protein DE146DRAFT_278235 [Phaeosphaeria sp. MPI-PUGE-AT-0046c]
MAPHQHLTRRAEITTNIWLDILALVIGGLGALFIIVVTCIIFRRKRARRHRERKMLAEQETRALCMPEPATTKTYLFAAPPYNAHEARVAHGGPPEPSTGRENPIELSGTIAEETRTSPQQLDGRVAPALAAYNGKPVEMPTSVATT